MTLDELVTFVEGFKDRYIPWLDNPSNVVEDYKEIYDGDYDGIKTKIYITFFKDKMRVAGINDVYRFAFSWNKDTDYLLVGYPQMEDQSFTDLKELLTTIKSRGNQNGI